MDPSVLSSLPIFDPKKSQSSLRQTWNVLLVQAGSKKNHLSELGYKNALLHLCRNDAHHFVMNNLDMSLTDLITLLGNRFEKVKTSADYMQDVNSFQRVPTDSLLQNIERLNNAIDEAYKNRGKKEREVVKETILREKMKLLVTPEVYKAAEIEEKRCNNSGKSFNFVEQCQLQESVLGGLGKGKFEGELNSNQIDGVCNTMVSNNAMVSNKPVSPHRSTSPNSMNFNRGGKIEK